MNAIESVEQSFTKEEKAEARKIEKSIEEVSKAILSDKQSLESNFVRLSQLIDEVRRKKYWLLGDYRNFGEYIADCEKRFGVKHSQLYVGMKVARNLLPSVPEQDLVDMGISKASVLSKYVEQSGQQSIPDEIMEAARNPKSTRDELDATVNSRLHNVSMERGKWRSIPGFFTDEEEWKEITDALDLAANIDPVVPNTLPAWQRTKECVLRLSREFLSSWSGNV